MSAAVNPAINQAGDLSRLEEIARPKIRVFNPTDYDDNVMVGGHYYAFPPQGVCVISDQIKHPREKDTTGRLRANTAKREIAMSAKDIALAIVDESNRGRKGFVILLGDGQDDERMCTARERYLTWRMEYALTVERTWVAQCTAYVAANPGSIPPRPAKSVRAELAWLDQNRKGYVGRRRFICTLDSLDYDVEIEALDHARLAHHGLEPSKVIVDTAVVLQGRPAQAQQAEDHGPDVPAAPEPLDTAVLLTKAEELGVNLVKAELAGLIRQDKDTIDAVTSKLAEAAAKRAEQANG